MSIHMSIPMSTPRGPLGPSWFHKVLAAYYQNLAKFGAAAEHASPRHCAAGQAAALSGHGGWLAWLTAGCWLAVGQYTDPVSPCAVRYAAPRAHGAEAALCGQSYITIIITLLHIIITIIVTITYYHCCIVRPVTCCNCCLGQPVPGDEQKAIRLLLLLHIIT